MYAKMWTDSIAVVTTVLFNWSMC